MTSDNCRAPHACKEHSRLAFPEPKKKKVCKFGYFVQHHSEKKGLLTVKLFFECVSYLVFVGIYMLRVCAL